MTNFSSTWIRLIASLALIASVIGCASVDDPRGKTPPAPSNLNAQG